MADDEDGLALILSFVNVDGCLLLLSNKVSGHSTFESISSPGNGRIKFESICDLTNDSTELRTRCDNSCLAGSLSCIR